MLNFEKLASSHNKIIVFTLDKVAREITVKAVESGGVWFQSESWESSILGIFKAEKFERPPIFFLPYSQILFAVQADNPANPTITAL